MSEKTYLLELTYENTGLNYKGLVSQRVIDKIRKKQFVEFNLLLGYDEVDEEDVATYARLYYHPSEKMMVNFTELSGE